MPSDLDIDTELPSKSSLPPALSGGRNRSSTDKGTPSIDNKFLYSTVIAFVVVVAQLREGGALNRELQQAVEKNIQPT
jgi:hypothetical protein